MTLVSLLKCLVLTLLMMLGWAKRLHKSHEVKDMDIRGYPWDKTLFCY